MAQLCGDDDPTMTVNALPGRRQARPSSLGRTAWRSAGPERDGLEVGEYGLQLHLVGEGGQADAVIGAGDLPGGFVALAARALQGRTEGRVGGWGDEARAGRQQRERDERAEAAKGHLTRRVQPAAIHEVL